MIRIAEMTAGWDRNAFLLAFCAVATELYPDLDWEDVEPRLQRSWERYLGDGDREWIEVRELVRERWNAQKKPIG
jgi:hypothetical protein